MFYQIFVSFLIMFFMFTKLSFACESCSVMRLGRDTSISSESQDQKWLVNYIYENQNWHEKDAGEAHRIHHQGRDFHDKTSEEFHHVTIGHHFNERMTVSTEIPYIIRHSLEVDDHSILGTRQKSKGLGDVQFVGDYKLLNENNKSVSALGGVKFPTGSTKEDNSIGTRFEPELQPGSGSYDYLLGAAYRQEIDRFGLVGNLAYVFRTEGAQDFRFGDLVSTSLIVDYLLNPDAKVYQTKIGLDGNIQYEQKHEEDGVASADSGGTTFLLGPTFNIQTGKYVSLFGSFLAPVAQDLGGVHQHLDFTWTAGGIVKW